jgi:hypothetical protein
LIGHLLGQAPALVVPLGLGRRVAAPDRDRAPPDPLDEREQLGPRLFGDDLPQQRSEQANLARQRVPGATQAGTLGLGCNRRKPA